MLSDSYSKRILRLFTPIFIYFGVTILCSVFYMAFCSKELMAIVNSSSQSAYEAAMKAYMEKANKDAMWLTGFVNLFTLPFLVNMYKKDSRRLLPLQVDSNPMHYALLAVTGVSVCIGLNFLLYATGISQMLENTYSETAAVIYSSPLWVQYIVSAILAPVLEEMIFRGLIYRRLRTYTIFPLAALISSIAFGAFHMNLLQFIYATALGLVLALVYEKFHSIIACIIVHGCGNASSVLASDESSGVPALLGGNDDRILITTIVSCVIGVASIVAIFMINKNKNLDNSSEIYEEVQT